MQKKSASKRERQLTADFVRGVTADLKNVNRSATYFKLNKARSDFS